MIPLALWAAKQILTGYLGLFINNEFVAAKSGKKITTTDPSTGEPITDVHAAGAEDIDMAVAAARKAFASPAWRDLDTTARGKLLLNLSRLVERDAHVLGTIDTWDNGKPYTAAMTEDIPEVISVFQYYGGWADKNFGQTIDTSPAKFAYTRHEPIGMFVAVCITNNFNCIRHLTLNTPRRVRTDYPVEFSRDGKLNVLVCWSLRSMLKLRLRSFLDGRLETRAGFSNWQYGRSESSRTNPTFGLVFG